jgi:hypothetical protein
MAVCPGEQPEFEHAPPAASVPGVQHLPPIWMPGRGQVAPQLLSPTRRIWSGGQPFGGVAGGPGGVAGGGDRPGRGCGGAAGVDGGAPPSGEKTSPRWPEQVRRIAMSPICPRAAGSGAPST